MSSPAASLPSDLLLVILEHVTVVDFIRFGAVCRSWRSAVSLFRSTKSDHLRRLKPQFPWLMFSDDSKPQSKYFYCISDRKIFHFHLPQIAGHRVIGSSAGFLITVDRATADLYALNPLTGAQIPLPPASTIPDLFAQTPSPLASMPIQIRFRFLGNRRQIGPKYQKAIICPSTHAMAVICGHRMQLVFMRPGDNSWTVLSRWPLGAFVDVVFHNGKLYAITDGGRLVAFGLDYPANRPVLLIDSHHVIYDPTNENDLFLMTCSYDPTNNACSYDPTNNALVVSPYGDDLFLMTRNFKWNDKDKEMRTMDFSIHVFKRDDKGNCKWEELNNVGELMMFMGSNGSMVMSSRDLSYPSSNLLWYKSDSNCFSFTTLNACDIDVFDLGSRRTEPVNIHCELLQLKRPLAMWFSPVL